MKYLHRFYLFLFSFIFLQTLQAAKVDTVSTYSTSMKKNIKAVVVTPGNYASLPALPVVYLLHGYGGNYADWVNRVPDVQRLSDVFSVIIVCPDGQNSWYWDSPVDERFKFETYVAGELVTWIDKHYNTIKDRAGRAITGLSMGGHGALYLAFRHQDVFGTAGSMSGGVDIRPFPKNWEMEKRMGSYAQNPENWEKNTVINMVHLLTPYSLALVIDCGTEDFFYRVNENLHQKLLERNIPHDYSTRPGAHNWPYWNNAIHYQVLYFSRFFARSINQ